MSGAQVPRTTQNEDEAAGAAIGSPRLEHPLGGGTVERLSGANWLKQ